MSRAVALTERAYPLRDAPGYEIGHVLGRMVTRVSVYV